MVEFIVGIITSIIKFINEISQGNQMIGGAISLGAMGAATYLLRSVPSNILAFMKKQLTTELSTTSSHQVFHDLLRWIQDNKYNRKVRRLKISNGRWGSDDDMTLSIGYGSHYIWHRWRLIKVTLEKLEGQTEYDKEIITLTKLGRSYKIFDELLNDIKNGSDLDKTSLYVFRNECWDFICKQNKRTFDSIIFAEGQLQLIKDTIDNFLSRENWYNKHGIPWHLGILLYGPPGTGKSSIAKAIAAYTNRGLNIVYDSATALNAIMEAETENVLLIEDIDSCLQNKNREDDTTKLLNQRSKKLGIGNMKLAHLLNVLDGPLSSHGRIVIMTTNYKEKLDKALLRPGRVDLDLDINYVTFDMFKTFVNKFYNISDQNIFSNRKLKLNNLTCATLQQDVLYNLTIDQIIEKHTIRV